MGFLRRYRTAAVFLLLIVALLVRSWISYRTTSKMAEGDAWVVHTYAVLQRLDDLGSKLQELQSEAGNKVNYGLDSPGPNHSATDQINQTLSALKQLTADNPSQQADLAQFRSRLTPLLATIASGAKGTNQSAQAEEEIRSLESLLGRMKSREFSLLAQRSGNAERILRGARISLLIGGLVTLSLAILGIFVTLQEGRQRSAVRESQAQLAAIVDSSIDAIIGKTLDGTITSWNAGAERFYGFTAEEMVGKSIYEIVPHSRADELRSILDRLGRGDRVEHLETVRHRRDGTMVDVDLTVSPIKDGRGQVIGASAIARDISDRKRFEQSLRQLSVRILQAQDEERRRIARELHDSTVQKLALLAMNLSQLHAGSLPDRQKSLVSNSEQLTRECVQELRTLSYVLHPPMLDELGLASALRIYVEGLSQRSGLEITIEADADWPRLPHEIEMALFRVAQEGLGNVLRHSGSKSAAIQLSQKDGIEMLIQDQGKGMAVHPSDTSASSSVGVGIAGMTERMKQLGGMLNIESGPRGTLLRVRLPYERRAYA